MSSAPRLAGRRMSRRGGVRSSAKLSRAPGKVRVGVRVRVRVRVMMRLRVRVRVRVRVVASHSHSPGAMARSARPKGSPG